MSTVALVRPGTAKPQVYRYALYWLTVESEIEIPEAAPVGDWDAGPVVHVRFGKVPERLEGGATVMQIAQVLDKCCLVRVPRVCAFLIENGSNITVEAESDASWEFLKAFLLGTALPVLLMQLGEIPLHVSAVLAPDGAVAFTGPSGSGKSTRAAKLHTQNNWPLVSDDVAVVKVIGNKAIIYSGVRRVRLWNDSIEMLGLKHIPNFPDHARAEKFQLDVSEKFVQSPVLLASVTRIKQSYITGGTEGLKTFDALTTAVHRPEFAIKILSTDHILNWLVGLAGILK